MTIRRCFCLAVAVVVLSGCAITHQTYVKDGKEYGVITGAFRGRWYNYYERALSYMEGKYYADAIADLRDAVRLRDKDQRRARTYGLHFIDYFPNRELGISLLQTGDIEGADGALQASLSHVDSGRAEFYLNATRREALRAKGVSDTSPPTFEFPGLNNSIRRQADFRLTGTIKDPSLVAAANLNGKVLLLPVAVDSHAVDIEMELAPGPNEIVLKAWDLFDNSAEMRATVFVDPEPPVISVGNLQEQAGIPILSGTVDDATSVRSLRANGEPQPVIGNDRKHMQFQIGAEAETLVIEAEDGAGNVAKITVILSELRERLASTDASPPTIQVSEVPATVYAEEVFLDGSVWDRGRVKSFTVAGKEIGTADKSTLYFRTVIPLKVGKNKILLEALDDDGQKSDKVLEIERRIPPLESIENRLSIAMAPFLPDGEIREATEAVEQNLENALVEQRRFHVLDRSRIAALVTEWQLVVTDLARDGPDLMELGAAVKSDVTMLGWIKEREASIEVYGRLVDTETGDILVEKDVFHEKKSLRNIRDLLAGLGLKFRAALPILEGIVSDATSLEELLITMENAQLLPNGARLLFVKIPDEEAWTQTREIVGEARVHNSDSNMARAALISGQVASDLAVITK